MVYKFICGHYGRDSEPPVGCKRAKIRGFIRVAELRGERPSRKRAAAGK